MDPAKTSESHPLYVDFVPQGALGLPGRLGMTLGPGTKDTIGQWDRDLETDLERLREYYRTDVLVSLMEEFEYGKYGVSDLFERARALGIEVEHFPIVDVNVPEPSKMRACVELVDRVVGYLEQEFTVVVHCRGGLGRTGTIVACVLVRLGYPCEEVVRVVRSAREGTLEAPEQERFPCEFEAWLQAHGQEGA